MAWNKETFREESLSLAIKSGELISSLSNGRNIPEIVGLPTKEEAFRMLCDGRFTED